MKITILLALIFCVFTVAYSAPKFENAFQSKLLNAQGYVRALGENPLLSFVSNCYTEETANEVLGINYDMYNEIAMNPPKKSAEVMRRFMAGASERLGKVHSILECVSKSDEIKRLVNPKIKMPFLSREFMEVTMKFAMAEPEEFHMFAYNIARYFNRKDFETVGTLFGLLFSRMGNWNTRNMESSNF